MRSREAVLCCRSLLPQSLWVQHHVTPTLYVREPSQAAGAGLQARGPPTQRKPIQGTPELVTFSWCHLETSWVQTQARPPPMGAPGGPSLPSMLSSFSGPGGSQHRWVPGKGCPSDKSCHASSPSVGRLSGTVLTSKPPVYRVHSTRSTRHRQQAWSHGTGPPDSASWPPRRPLHQPLCRRGDSAQEG